MIGVREVIKNRMTADFELTYRNIISGGEVYQIDGLTQSIDGDRHLGYNTMGFGIAIGYLF